MESKSSKISDWKESLCGKANLERLDRYGREFYIVVAEHFSKQAGDYIKEVANEVRQNPKKWLFLIEGGVGSGIHECEIAQSIARELDVPIHDPIFVHYSDPKIIKLYLHVPETDLPETDLPIGPNYPRKETEEFVYGLILHILASISSSDNSVYISKLYQAASLLGLDPQLVPPIHYVSKLKDEKKATAKEEDFKNRVERLKNDLLYISNVISAQVLDYYLRKNPDKKNVLLYLGSSHKEILDIDINAIPISLRLNDERIEELLRKREEQRKK